MPLEFEYKELEYKDAYKYWPPLQVEVFKPSGHANETVCRVRVDDACQLVRAVTHSGSILPLERRYNASAEGFSGVLTWPPLKHDVARLIEDAHAKAEGRDPRIRVTGLFNGSLANETAPQGAFAWDHDYMNCVNNSECRIYHPEKENA